jgi:DNA polymerase
VTEAERRAALDAIAAEVRACHRCRLHEARTQAVPGEGHSSTEVVFVGEGPGFNEDKLGRPFVGRAGDLLVRLLASIGWRRDEVFITNVVKCRPPENRDPEPDEIAACAPYLKRQLEVLDPALVVTLGRHSMARFMPGARISQSHGTVRPADPETGARDAVVFAMYHPAAALRSTEVERQSYEDVGRVPDALVRSRERRDEHERARVEATSAAVSPAVLRDTETIAQAPELAPVAVAAGTDATVATAVAIDFPTVTAGNEPGNPGGDVGAAQAAAHQDAGDRPAAPQQPVEQQASPSMSSESAPPDDQLPLF